MAPRRVRLPRAFLPRNSARGVRGIADHVLTGLTERRAELAGEAEAIRARLARIATDLGHLVRLFDPDHDVAGIRPKRARGPRVAGRGEMARLVPGALRDAPGPMVTADVVERVMAARGMGGRRRQDEARGDEAGREWPPGGSGRTALCAPPRGRGVSALWEIVR